MLDEFVEVLKLRATEDLEQARSRVLRAETSYNFYWREAWVERCHHDLDAATACLNHALRSLSAR